MTTTLRDPVPVGAPKTNGTAIAPSKRHPGLIEITIKDEDLGREMALLVEPRMDDLGQYAEPNRVWLVGGLVWFGDVAEPMDMPHDGRSAGRWIETKYRDEIDREVRREIERRCETVES